MILLGVQNIKRNNQFERDKMDIPSEQALHVAARIWCDEEMSHIPMDNVACAAIARIIDKVIKENEENSKSIC